MPLSKFERLFVSINRSKQIQTDLMSPTTLQLKIALTNHYGFKVPALPNHIWMDIIKLTTRATRAQRRKDEEEARQYGIDRSQPIPTANCDCGCNGSLKNCFTAAEWRFTTGKQMDPSNTCPPSVEVFMAQGSNPLQGWKVFGPRTWRHNALPTKKQSNLLDAIWMDRHVTLSLCHCVPRCHRCCPFLPLALKRYRALLRRGHHH